MVCATAVLLWTFLATSYAQTTWAPTDLIECRTNEDCGDLQNVCCSITAMLGKRQLVDGEFYPYVHYCLPYKTIDNPWCVLDRSYSPLTPNYHGLCPCGPGLRCTPTTELNPDSYPREKFGKCTAI